MQTRADEVLCKATKAPTGEAVTLPDSLKWVCSFDETCKWFSLASLNWTSWPIKGCTIQSTFCFSNWVWLRGAHSQRSGGRYNHSPITHTTKTSNLWNCSEMARPDSNFSRITGFSGELSTPILSSPQINTGILHSNGQLPFVCFPADPQNIYRRSYLSAEVPLVLNPSTNWRWMVTFTLQRLQFLDNNYRAH